MSVFSSILTRVAPSPTGKLHVGNARRALENWLFARQAGGRFMLRMDDTDIERSKEIYELAIQKDLEWLGLNWDLYVRQSDRMEHYQAAAQKLKSLGRLYPCYETSEELEFKRKRLLSRGLPPLYDRSALSLTEAQKKAYEKEGRTPHWRFLLNPTKICWDDLIHGTLCFEGEKLSDPVLIKTDGFPVYSLASVVDDLDFKVSHVIRGDDHITNTALQIQLIEALGADPLSIHFAHLPLLTDASGGGLSKRLGSLSIESLKEDGFEPMAINSLLARLGSSDPIEPFLSLDPLVSSFNIEKFSKATAKFDVQELKHLNAKIIHMMPFSQAKKHLESIGITGVSEEFWNTLHGNFSTFSDVTKWLKVLHNDFAPLSFSSEDLDYLKLALTFLPEEPWGPETWKNWTDVLKEKTDRKGKMLFMPLRLALTGEEHGPEMKDFLPLLGYDVCLKRLKDSYASDL
ncbi:MAG: glutamate--tRNA ligase [Alphaproteobacteria bacterium 16-39-46]|nr:MAG: glutamate--tRNA ligase [Alphaproteobacteria bacterium 16-39-46]OZA44282.1 MAG: glutamate--tRNA ligase [Alphaproteobacteria bacterium 17-39-52]HQS83489.1 glutamate--tRNA ligase [Alphaproteobacteria bacterium]HQS93212.1 glutamate--tRNA ligase [Alphaproteobacteria bacterium]